MRIGSRLFPYPILNSNQLYSQFKNASFSLSYDEEIFNDTFSLNNLICKLDSKYLCELIAEGKAEIVCIVECASTMYRKAFDVMANVPNKIDIPLSDLNGKYGVSAFIVAKEDFEYSCNDFHDDYEGYSFQVEKHDILAADDGFVNSLSFDEEENTTKASIFIVIKDLNINDGTMRISYDSSKIQIDLPEKQWNIYDKMKKLKRFQSMYFSLLAIPALTYAIMDLRKNPDASVDSMKIEYKWFSSFAEKYKEIHNKDLGDEEFFIKMNPYQEAQLIFDSPVTKAIDTIFDMTMNVGGDIDGD